MAILSVIILYFSIYSGKKNNLTSRIYIHVLLSYVFILGIALAAFDQYVNQTMVQYLIFRFHTIHHPTHKNCK